jgi:hypothetical protein
VQYNTQLAFNAPGALLNMTNLSLEDSEHQQLQRDGHWSVYSPPLIALPSQGFPSKHFFTELAFEEAPLAWPAPTDWQRFRLGIQFERLWQCALRHLKGYELLASNLQVQGPTATLGEFDLIVQNGDTLEHWELAVKFYLGTGDTTQASAWFGPNPTDRLDLKLQRLLSHQMALTKTPVGQNLLTNRFGTSNVKVKGIVKGRLFHPFTAWQAAHWNYPAAVTADHLRGWWLTDADFIGRFKDGRQRFRPLTKRDWLSTLQPVPIDQRLTATDCMTALAASREQFAHHIAMIDDNGLETSRGFVVMPPWLAITQARDPAA